MRIYLSGLCAAGINHFNDTFTSFYARQCYNVTNDVTRASLTVEDPLLIKALHVEKGWRCGSNDCGISCQTVETTHVFTHERTYEQPFMVTMSASTNRPTTSASMEENIARNQQFYRQNSISYLHRQFNDRYITSFIINVYFRPYIFQG